MRRRVTCHPCRQAPSFGHQRFTDGGAKNTPLGVFITLGPLYCRAVSVQVSSKRTTIENFNLESWDCLRSSKSFAARPCNLPIAAKHMLFYLPGLRHRDNFIIT